MTMNEKYLLGVDIGTTTSKGALISVKRETVATFSVEHGVSRPNVGWSEHDAEKIWWREFCDICKTLLEKSGIHPGQIVAVGCSTLFPVLLPVDKKGNPLRPAILYEDARAFKEIEILKNSLGDDYSARTSGNKFTTQTLAPKILWLKRNEPEVFNNTAMFHNASSYLVYRLTKNNIIDHGSASQGGLPYSTGTLDWDPGPCQEIEIKKSQLPGLLWGNEVAGHITKMAAHETGLTEGTPVAAGSGDFFAEMLGLGAQKKGRAVITYGSTFGLGVCTDKSAYNPDLVKTSFCLKNVYLLGGGMASGSFIIKWFKENLGRIESESEDRTGVNAYHLLDEGASEIPPGCEGLVALPYFNGERCPVQDPQAKGMIFGLTLRHTRKHIYRALLESIGFGIHHILDKLNESKVKIDEVRSVGGGAQSAIWPQIISDITQLEQGILKYSHGAPYGAAFLAGLSVEAFDQSGISIDKEWNNTLKTVIPHVEHKAIYEKNYEIYLRLYQKTSQEMHMIDRES